MNVLDTKTYFIVCTDIDDDRQTLVRLYAGQSSIKGQFTNRNAHTVRSQIAETKNTLTVSYNDGSDVIFWPVAKHAVDVVLVVNRDEETARTPVDVAELLASQTNGRSVNQGHHLLDVFRKDAIKQALVTILAQMTKLDNSSHLNCEA